MLATREKKWDQKAERHGKRILLLSGERKLPPQPAKQGGPRSKKSLRKLLFPLPSIYQPQNWFLSSQSRYRLLQTFPTPNRKTRKTVPKEFGKAHSYAEKRLATALKERAEYMQKVAMLNAEIPSLVQVIRALGGQVNPQALTMTMQGFPVPDGSMVPMQPTVDLPQMPPDGIDPGLYRTNAAPIPGLPPPTAPIVPGAAMGGGMDLDYVPKDDEPPQRGGGGWA